MNTVSHRKSCIDDISLIDAHYQNFAFKRHYHLDYHLGLITAGQQQYYFNGASHQAGAGQLVIMPPGEIHDGQPEQQQGYKVKVFSITPDWLDHQACELSGNCQVYFPQHNVTDSQLFCQLSQLHTQLSDPHFPQLAKDCMPIEYFSQFISRYSQIRPQHVVPLGSKDLLQLRDYLMANLDQKISLDNLAALCELSPSQLLRQFKKATGMTPYAWLARLRLEHAMALLKAGYSCTDVAYHVGFYDQAHFTRTFRLTFGVAPSEIK
ncbi:AraC family transcriptional regulator [Photobacterium sp. SDRW27]|uniref:AraC family transcriptional regulator n=1 Tax=Photobacterium obscurum TaxID=2829490 RepID=UPI002243A309|nr:AraC family transcriptional regulator [Photobacterium obscurum]MCW8331097.1 AraC family transcriptional regulator [Photobacterium obscurum]